MTTDILADLKGENNQAFGRLYQSYFGMVDYYIIKNSGSTNDAEDIFQDTMVVLIEKLRQDNFQLTASIKTYIMAIAKNLWLKRLRNNRVAMDFELLYEDEFMQEIDLSIEAEKSYKDKLQNYMHKITKHCKGLIHDIFFKEKAIEQIQKEYGYTSIHNAQNQKHKCIEQIRKVKAREEKTQN